MDKPTYTYSSTKNLKLLQERGVGFEDIITILDTKGCLAVINHPNPAKYPNQKVFVVEINNYVYLVPFERNHQHCVLKTIYPSRKMARLYQEKLRRGEKS